MGAILQVQGITKRFGGLIANHNLNFSLNEGQIVGLIGPNGAGKTTLFNCLTGFLKPDTGIAVFMEKNIIGLPPQKCTELGMARTFQVTKTFVNMTVLENVLVGALLRRPRLKDAMEFTVGVLEFTGLGDKASLLGSALTVADRKRLEIARALATEPRLLMLDEAMAGLNPTEVADAVKLVRRIRDKGITVLLVEHIMEVVMPLSDWVLVMANGALIAEGTPGAIATNERVIEAYLGEKWNA